MKRIKVAKIPITIKENDQDGIDEYLRNHHINSMSYQPWVQYQSDSQVNFVIAHHHDRLLVKFDVKERELNASVRPVNGNIHQDNCVEIFIAFGNDTNYYNCEFNCLGSAKVGYGKSKNGRTLLTEEMIKKVRINAALNFSTGTTDQFFNWEMLIIIPKDLFQFSSIETFTGAQCKANFYKCGDHLSAPHFFSWNLVESIHPDFHQPKFFGELLFE